MKSKFKTLYTLLIVVTMVTAVFLAGCAKLPSAGQSAPSGTSADKPAPQASAESGASSVRMSYVSIDINPSIELALMDGAVAEAKAYNDDGAAIILTTDVIGMAPEEAVTALVGSFVSEGYITEGEERPSIVITVAGGQHEGLAESLKQNAEKSLQDHGLDCSVVTTNVAEEIVQAAQSCGLSTGRYLVLKQIALQKGISLEQAKEQLGGLKMNELLNMIEDVDGFMQDLRQINSAIDSLTPGQLEMLMQLRSEFQQRMRSAQQEFLAARTQAKDAFHKDRDAAKDIFLAGKDKELLKAAKQRIKDAFALAKKTATDALKQAKIKAREDFMAAAAGFGLDQETIDKLLEWEFDNDFDVDMDFGFEDADDETNGKQYEGSSAKSDEKKDSSKDKGGQGKGKGNSKKAIMGDDNTDYED